MVKPRTTNTVSDKLQAIRTHLDAINGSPAKYLSVSLQGVEPRQGRPRAYVKPGRYSVQVINIEEALSRNGKPMILVTNKILHPDYQEAVIVDNMVLEQFGLNRLAAFFEAIDADPSVDALNTMIGSRCRADIGDNVFNGKVRSSVIAYHREA